MKLLTLQMYNFRPFYGETPKMSFADGEKNTTIIHAANGAGKTTLLNAFTWLFYRGFTDAFALRDQLINKRAVRLAEVGQSLDCWVELMFEHHGRKYIARRSKHFTKVARPDKCDEGPERITMSSAGEDGRWSTRKDEEIPDIIGRILPEKLLPYFFFDGERIERLQRSNKQPEVISATTMLVGEEVLNRALNHLDDARKKLENELKSIGDAETAHLIDDKVQVEAQLDEHRRKLDQWEKNLDGYRKRKDGVEQSLRQLDSVQKLQKQRDILSAQYRDLEQAVMTSRNILASLTSGQGYKAYLEVAVKSFRDLIGALKSKGQLPGPIKAPFVRSLLIAQRCICGRPLHEGQDAYQEVQKWEEIGGMTEVEQVALRMEGTIDSLDREIPGLFAQIDNEQKARATARDKMGLIETELIRIHEELKGSVEEDARQLEIQRVQVEEAIDRTRRWQFQSEQEIKTLNNRLTVLNNEIQRREGVTATQQLASRRLTACLDTYKTLLEVRNKLRTNFRVDLNERINHLFTKMSFKPYQAVLDEHYCLYLVDGVSDAQVPLSTGESALLSLAFIGAVINQARELTARRDRLPGPDSSVYPIVMDSPFGNLDPIYRRQVAKHIPELAYQVVSMVSKTQFQGEVETTIHNRIGKEYVLCYYTPKNDAQEDSIVRGGQPYGLVKRGSDEDEWTEIQEVSRVG